MVDRPIIFSAPMVRALLAGRKTQTRRAISSPLRYAKPGDRLYVREAWRTLHKWDCLKPVHLMHDPSKITFDADPECRNPLWAFGKGRPSIHMPRWTSRLTLVVTEVRWQRLQDISEADAQAEGIEPGVDPHGRPGGWKSYETYPDGSPHPHAIAPNREARASFREIWEMLHGAGSWETASEVVALTFVVHKVNIDWMGEESNG